MASGRTSPKRAAGKSNRNAKPAPKRRPGGQTFADDELAAKKARILAELEVVPMYFLAAAAAEVHPSTLAKWRQQDEAFDLACRRARAVPIRRAVLDLRHPDAATSAGAARYLEKVAPAEFKRDDFRDDLAGADTGARRVVFEVVRSTGAA